MTKAAGERRLALRVRNVVKDYHGTRALAGVSLDIGVREIHAICGANGSGKSTLVKVLAGLVRPDEGTLELNGRTHDLRHFSPGAARHQGLYFVHQQPSTFGEFTVAENLAIGRGYETDRLGRIRWRSVRTRVEAVLERFRIDARPEQKLRTLRPATQTMVAIARVLQDEHDRDDDRLNVLVLDEPTAAMPADDVEVLLGALRRLSERGQSIIFISHRIEEVLALADRVTVFRDGRVVADVPRAELDHASLVEHIVGRPLEAHHAAVAGCDTAQALLEVSDLRGGAVRGATFKIGAGELVGVAGLGGAGRSTLLRLLFGAQHAVHGSVRVAGDDVRFRSPADAMRAGVAYVPEDRAREALFLDRTVVENLSAGSVHSFARFGRIDRRREYAAAVDAAERFLIRAPSLRVLISALSGGNQQKGVLARWLRREPGLLLLDEPTQGVDASGRAELWGLIRRAVDAGAGALVVSSEFEELEQLCDRVLLMQQGWIVGDVANEQLTADNLNHLLHAEKRAA